MPNIESPFYQKFSLNLLSLSLLGAIIYLAQGIIIPLLFAILLATLLLPVTNFLQRIKIPKIPSILLTIFIALGIIGGILYFLSHQISVFLEDIDTIKARITTIADDFQSWINNTFKVSEGRQNQYIRDTAQNIKDSGPGFVGRTVMTITEMLSYVIFLPVYTFLILFYKDLIKRFIISLFKRDGEDEVRQVIFQARSIGQFYVLGLSIDMAIVFTLNAIGFLILGIKYPIFLALVAALLNLIPYIGMLIANLFCMLITLVTSPDISSVIWVAVILAAVQFVDNNFLIPMIVGNKVRINALVTIVGVVIGGALCGVSGMFLAIPTVAVLKVIFDHVDGLKPWGILLGDDVTGADRSKKSIK